MSARISGRFARAAIAVGLAAIVMTAGMVATALAQSKSAKSKSTAAPYQAAVDAEYTKFKDLKEGKNADYIPALAEVDPNIFGIAL